MGLTIKDIKSEIQTQSQSHPDKSLRNFYSNLYSRLEEETVVYELILDVTQSRSDITNKHFVNLFYRAFQYVMIYNFVNYELADLNEDAWNTLLDEVLSDESSLATFKELILNENTQTTIYQRYLGPKAALWYLFKEKKLSILDIGCGLNIGLPGIEKDIPFTEIEDKTNGKAIDECMYKSLNIHNSYAVDIYDPKIKRDWALACGFYPGELHNLEKVKELCEIIWKSTNIQFYQKDILKIDELWKSKKLDKVDAVIASTILYQFEPKEVSTALKALRKVIKHPGVLIINDFIHVEDDIIWDVDWFKDGKPSYKTVMLPTTDEGFSKPYEFITWNNGRCKIAHPGKHFEDIVNFKQYKFN